MQAPSIILNRPSVAWVPSYLEFLEELRSLGEQIWDDMAPAAGQGAADFVARLHRSETEALLPMVPRTTYWATRAGEVVGRGVLRHELTPELAELGGHISYEVRPSARRQGVATQLLRQLLKSERAQGMGSLLVTCSPSNLGSNKAIQANGGRLEKTRFVERVNRETNYYWIDV